MKNLLLNYFNSYSSPQRERVIGFWMSMIIMIFTVLLAMATSACSSAYQCPTYSGSRDHHPARIIKH